MCHGFSCIDNFNAHSSTPLTIATWAQRLPIFSSFTSHGWRTIWTLCRYFHSPVPLLWGLGYLNGSLTWHAYWRRLLKDVEKIFIRRNWVQALCSQVHCFYCLLWHLFDLPVTARNWQLQTALFRCARGAKKRSTSWSFLWEESQGLCANCNSSSHRWNATLSYFPAVTPLTFSKSIEQRFTTKHSKTHTAGAPLL